MNQEAHGLLPDASPTGTSTDGGSIDAGLKPAARYSDGAYLEANPDWHAEDAPWKVRHMRRICDAAGIAPRSMCEVGCGSGAGLDLMQAAYPGSRADGYELSPQAFALCSARTRPGLSFYSDSAFTAGRHYDLSMAIDVIEHVEDPFAFARGMGAISDHQLFHIPLDMNVVALAREWPIREARGEVGHIHYFSRWTATSLLEECGLRVVNWHYVPWALEQGGGTWKRWLGALPRRMAYAANRDAAVRILGGWSLMILTKRADA